MLRSDRNVRKTAQRKRNGEDGCRITSVAARLEAAALKELAFSIDWHCSSALCLIAAALLLTIAFGHSASLAMALHSNAFNMLRTYDDRHVAHMMLRAGQHALN